jgi:hypothetical protein
VDRLLLRTTRLPPLGLPPRLRRHDHRIPRRSRPPMGP